MLNQRGKIQIRILLNLERFTSRHSFLFIFFSINRTINRTSISLILFIRYCLILFNTDSLLFSTHCTTACLSISIVERINIRRQINLLNYNARNILVDWKDCTSGFFVAPKWLNLPKVKYFPKLMLLKTANHRRKAPLTTVKISNMHFTRKKS